MGERMKALLKELGNHNTLYHGSSMDFDVGEKLSGEINLTDDWDASDDYATYNAGEGEYGWVYEVAYPESINWADEDELKEAGEDVGVDCDYIFFCADNSEVQEKLLEDGYQGIRYGDVSPDNRTDHDTWRIIDEEVDTIIIDKDKSRKFYREED